MKIRNNTRIMALVLALVMLLPLISIPTFAEPAAQAEDMELLWSLDFEEYEGRTEALVKDKNLSTVPKNIYAATEGDNTYLLMDCAKYNNDTATSFNNSTLEATGVALDSATTPWVTLQADYYFSAEMAHNFVTQLHGSSAGNWFNLFTTVPTNTKIAACGAKSSGTGILKINAWNTIQTVIDMVNGDVYIIVNGEYACNYSSGAKNIKVSAGQWLFGKTGTSTAVATSGVVKIDNLAIFAGKPEMGAKVLYKQDFDSVASVTDAANIGKTLSTLETATLNSEELGKVLRRALTPAEGENPANGGQNLANFTYLKNDAATNDIITLSAKYYFSPDAKSHQITSRIWTTGGNVNLFKLGVDAGKVTLSIHGDSGTAEYVGGSWTGTTGGWIKIDVVYNQQTGIHAVYANNQFVFSVNDERSSEPATLKAINWGICEVARGSGTVNNVGYIEIDDCVIYEGDVTKPLSYTADPLPEGVLYNYDLDALAEAYDLVNGAAVSHGYGIVSEYLLGGMSLTKVDGKTAFRVESRENNNQSKIANPEILASNVSDFVYSYDVYVPSGTQGKTQFQAMNIVGKKADGSDYSNGFNQVAQITASGDALFISNAESAAAKDSFSLAWDTWMTISIAFHMAEGTYDIYVDGYCAFDAKKIGSYATFTKIPAQSFMFGKVNNKTGLTGGAFCFAEPTVYVGTAPTNAFQSYTVDFNSDTAVTGASVPGSAKLVAGYTGNGVDITMGSAKVGDADYKFVITGSRVVNVSRDKGSAASVVLPDDEDPSIFYAFANDHSFSIKFKYDENGENGEVIHVLGYHHLSKNKYYPTEVRTDVKALKAYEGIEWTGEEDLPIRHTLAELEMGGVGVVNIDKQFKPYMPAFTVAAFDSYVLEAKYFVSENAKGVAESQLVDTSYQNLFVLDTTNARITGNSKTAASFEKGTWITVTVVIPNSNVAQEGELYLNGIYIGKTGQVLVANGITGNEWSVFKVMKSTDPNNFAGSVIVDDVSIKTTFTESAIPGILDVEAFENGALESVNGASIRLTDPTGLRFASAVDTDKLAILDKLVSLGKIKSYNMGTLIAPASYAEAAGGFSKAELKKLNVATAYVDVPFDGVYFSGDTGFDASAANYVVGSIVRIKDKNVDREFAGAAYIEIVLNDDTVYSIYADAQVRSVKYVADQARKDAAKQWTTEQLDVLNAYADHVAPQQ